MPLRRSKTDVCEFPHFTRVEHQQERNIARHCLCTRLVISCTTRNTRSTPSKNSKATLHSISYPFAHEKVYVKHFTCSEDDLQQQYSVVSDVGKLANINPKPTVDLCPPSLSLWWHHHKTTLRHARSWIYHTFSVASTSIVKLLPDTVFRVTFIVRAAKPCECLWAILALAQSWGNSRVVWRGHRSTRRNLVVSHFHETYIQEWIRWEDNGTMYSCYHTSCGYCLSVYIFEESAWAILVIFRISVWTAPIACWQDLAHPNNLKLILHWETSDFAHTSRMFTLYRRWKHMAPLVVVEWENRRFLLEKGRPGSIEYFWTAT